MTIRDLLELFMEDDCQEVEIYDINKGETVFKGTAFEAMDSEYEYSEVSSIDNLSVGTDVLTINI